MVKIFLYRFYTAEILQSMLSTASWVFIVARFATFFSFLNIYLVMASIIIDMFNIEKLHFTF